jgi:hypothetical protein
MERFQERTGLPVNDYNERCYRQALDHPDKLDHYLYLKGGNARRLLLHDVEDARGYFRRHGREIAALLRGFGIEQVVHGHRPLRSGVQADYEFRRWLPGVRMIGNDTQLRLRGLGAVAMRMAPEQEPQVLFVNTRNRGGGQRKLVKRALRAGAAEGSVASVAPMVVSPVVNRAAVVGGHGGLGQPPRPQAALELSAPLACVR